MIYTYSMEIQSEEHFLYPREIAEIYGLYTLKDQPNARLVNLVLEEYRIKNGLDPYPVITYETKFGPSRCYPHVIYDPAMQWFVQTARLVTSYQFTDGPKANFRIR